MRFIEVFKEFDWVLFSACMLLIFIGLAMLMSITGVETVFSQFVITQSVAAGIGIVAIFALAKIPYRVWKRYALVWYGVGSGLLVALMLTERAVRGSVRWITVYGFQIQPSEVMKVAIVITLAWLLSRYTYTRWKQVALSGLLLVLPVAIILLAPDLGSAAVIVLAWFGILLFLGLPWKIIGTLLAFTGVAFAGLWQWVLLDYQKLRIQTFLNPAENPLGAGYNVMQAMIAFGSGQLMGRGLGQGPQSQLQFLPEHHTDFILASIGEEMGFVGIMIIITLYAVIFWRIVRIMKSTNDTFGQILCAGAFFILLAGFIVSAGMNVGLMPITGIPLPFVSYGGSSLVTSLLLIGFVQSVKVHNRFSQAPPVEISNFV